MTTEKQLLTHSRQNAFKTCRRQHYYLYELGLRRIEDAKALRQGAAFHDGIAALPDLAAACEAVRARYAHMPPQFEAYWWDIERETILRLVCGYQWRWGEAALEVVATEMAFQIPLVNPSTGAESKIWDAAGKIDGIVRLEDGRLAVKETKTTGDDIGQGSDLWRRLRIDHQISLYIHAARQLGYQVDTVLYDVVRKPTIQPTPVPLLDEQGRKVVLDPNGERVFNIRKGSTAAPEPRQTADKEKGYVLQTRPMTVQEWGEKLSADIAERPDYYFARVEVPRLNQDVEDYRDELWQIQQALREAQRTGKWFRTVTRNTCPFCPFFEPCSSSQNLTKVAPPGFHFVSDIHPELERSTNGNSHSVSSSVSTQSAAASPAPGATEGASAHEAAVG